LDLSAQEEEWRDVAFQFVVVVFCYLCWTKRSRKKGHHGLGLLHNNQGWGVLDGASCKQSIASRGAHQWGPGLRFSRAR
jgi:hypothetical protein